MLLFLGLWAEFLRCCWFYCFQWPCDTSYKVLFFACGWFEKHLIFRFFVCSLHYINPYQPNEYQRAISAVGSVIEGYDNDRLFPCFGYGGKLPNGTVRHRVSNRKTTPKKALIFWPFLFFFLPFFLGVQFALNGVEANPECVGISGILQAYQGALTVLF